MTSTNPQRWARVAPGLAWKHPGLPRDWTPVLEQNPEAINPEPLRGYVWLGGPKPLHVWAAHLEFRDGSDDGA